MAHHPQPAARVTAGLTILALALAACSPSRAAGDPPLVLKRSIPLAGVTGRIDHLAVDVAHGRLFVAELGNGAVEAIDLKSGRSLGRISGLKEPQGLAYLARSDELVVASGGDGSVRSYGAGDLKPHATLSLGADADNLRVDQGGRLVVGYGRGGLAVIDPGSFAVVARSPLAAHPEGFQLIGARALVNVPDAGQIVLADLSSGKVVSSWKTTHRWNFPMALAGPGRAAVVYRLPSRLAVLETATGRVVADRSACGDADDLVFDARRARLYVVCGSGSVDVVETASGRYASLGSVRTRAGARTGLFVPEADRLFVAARGRGDAAILVFRPQSRTPAVDF